LTFNVKCESCGKEFVAEEVQEGAVLKCPACGSEINLLKEEKPDIASALAESGVSSREEPAPPDAAMETEPAGRKAGWSADVYYIGVFLLIAWLFIESFHGLYNLLSPRISGDFSAALYFAAGLVVKFFRMLIYQLTHPTRMFVYNPAAPAKEPTVGDGLLLWLAGVAVLMRMIFKTRLFAIGRDSESRQRLNFAQGMIFLALVGLMEGYMRFAIAAQSRWEQILAGILLGVVLLTAGVWFLVIFFHRRKAGEGSGAPFLLSGLNNAFFGVMLLAYMIVHSRYASLFTPGAAVGIMALANSAIGFRIDGAPFEGERRQGILGHLSFLLIWAVFIFVVAAVAAYH